MPISAKQRRVQARNAGLASAAARTPEKKAEIAAKASAARWAGHIKKERPFIPSSSDPTPYDLASADFSFSEDDGEWETIEGEE